MSKISSPRLHVVIPAYNEEQTLPRVMESLQALPLSFTNIVVVDNASTDATPILAKQWGARVLAEPQRGYGAACLRGLSYLREQFALREHQEGQDIVIFLDADYSDYPEDMPLLLNPIFEGDADFVVGSRLNDPLARRAVPLAARWGNRFAMTVLRYWYGVRFSDMGPFRVITWDALDFLEMEDRTWGWTLEMQLKAAHFGLRIREVPVRYRLRGGGKSKISQSFSGVLKASTKILWVLASHRFRCRNMRKFQPRIERGQVQRVVATA